VVETAEYNFPAFHNKLHFFEFGYVGYGVARSGNDIRELDSKTNQHA
jgi:hypothetical protein